MNQLDIGIQHKTSPFFLYPLVIEEKDSARHFSKLHVEENGGRVKLYSTQLDSN